MKNTIKIIGIIAFAAIIGFAMVSCKGKDGGSSAASTSRSSASLTPMDKLLDDYEKLTDEMIPVVQRAMAGDAAAAAELESLTSKAEALAEQWEGYVTSETSITPAQAARWAAIATKMQSSFGF